MTYVLTRSLSPPPTRTNNNGVILHLAATTPPRLVMRFDVAAHYLLWKFPSLSVPASAILMLSVSFTCGALIGPPVRQAHLRPRPDTPQGGTKLKANLFVVNSHEKFTTRQNLAYRLRCRKIKNDELSSSLTVRLSNGAIFSAINFGFRDISFIRNSDFCFYSSSHVRLFLLFCGRIPLLRSFSPFDHARSWRSY